MRYLNNVVHKKIKIIFSIIFAIFLSTSFISCNGLDITKIPTTDGGESGGGTGDGSGDGAGGDNSNSLTSRPLLFVNPVIGLEGETLVFTVSLSKPATKSIGVTYSATPSVSSKFLKIQNARTQYMLIQKKASPNNDYEATSGSLTFAKGERQKTVSIPLKTDTNVTEGLESFALNVRIHSANSKDLSNTSNSVTGLAYIVDKIPNTEENPINSEIYFPASIEAVENQGSISIPFVIYPALKQRATLAYATERKTTLKTGAYRASLSDYTSTQKEKSLAVGSTTSSIEITLTNDSIYEGNEIFKLFFQSQSVQLNKEGSSTNTQGNLIVVPITIKDDEEKPYLNIQTRSLTEASTSQVAAILSLSWPSERPVSIEYETEDGTAEAATDFTAIAKNKLTLSGSKTIQTNIDVTLKSDNIKESKEQFKLKFSLPIGLRLRSLTSEPITSLEKEITITEQVTTSSVSVNLVSSVLRFKESSAENKILLTLSEKSSTDQIITYTLSPYGTTNPANSDDYTDSTSGSVTIAAGTLTKEIKIIFPVDDDEVDEKLQLRLSTVSGGAILGNTNSAIITIVGAAEPASVGFSTTTATTAVENIGTKNIALTLSKVVSTDVVVSYKIINDTATTNDYTDSNRGRVTFKANTTTKNIVLNITEDQLDEVDETFKIIITNVTGAVRGANYISNVTITDNDSSVTIQVASSASTVREGLTKKVKVTLSAISGKDINLAYTVTGTAADHKVLSPITLRIPAGQQSATIDIKLIADNIFEATAENIVITLTGGGDTYTLGTAKVHTITITESLSLPKASFKSAKIAHGEGTITTNDKKSLKIPVVLDHASTVPVTLSYTLSETGLSPATGSVPAPTSPETVDYVTPGTKTITFAVGTTETFITIETNQDSISEGNETFKVTLTAPTATATLGSQKSTVVTIYDDDGLPEVTLPETISVDEGAITANTITLTLETVSTKTVTVNYTLTAGATNPASLTDYSSRSGSVTFAAGDLTTNITFRSTQDLLDEEYETVLLTLTSASNAALATNKTTVITITDDDALPTLKFDTATVSSAEGTTVVIPVILSTLSGKDVTVNYSLASSGSGTGKAVAEDYTDRTPPKPLIIRAGTKSTNISILLNTDSNKEETETFVVTLAKPGNAGLGVSTTKTVSIVDSDSPPTISLESSTMNCDEGVYGVTRGKKSCSIKVNFSGTSANPIYVNYTLSGGTAAKGVGKDYYDNAGGELAAYITPSKLSDTISTQINSDAFVEGDETFTLTLTSVKDPTSATIDQSKKTIVVTIKDKTPVLSIASTKDCNESTTGTVDCNIAITSSADYAGPVTYKLDGRTATAAEYTATTETTVTLSGTTTNVAIPIKHNPKYSADKTFNMTLVSAPGAAISTSKKTVVTIKNKDKLQIGFKGSPATRLTTETDTNFSISLVVNLKNLDGRLPQNVTVDYLIASGTATRHEDFIVENLEGTLTFSGQGSEKTIPITIVGDTIHEASPENFTITLSSPTLTLAPGVVEIAGPTVKTIAITDNDTAPSGKITYQE